MFKSFFINKSILIKYWFISCIPRGQCIYFRRIQDVIAKNVVPILIRCDNFTFDKMFTRISVQFYTSISNCTIIKSSCCYILRSTYYWYLNITCNITRIWSRILLSLNPRLPVFSKDLFFTSWFIQSILPFTLWIHQTIQGRLLRPHGWYFNLEELI